MELKRNLYKDPYTNNQIHHERLLIALSHAPQNILWDSLWFLEEQFKNSKRNSKHEDYHTKPVLYQTVIPPAFGWGSCYESKISRWDQGHTRRQGKSQGSLKSPSGLIVSTEVGKGCDVDLLSETKQVRTGGPQQPLASRLPFGFSLQSEEERGFYPGPKL